MDADRKSSAREESAGTSHGGFQAICSASRNAAGLGLGDAVRHTLTLGHFRTDSTQINLPMNQLCLSCLPSSTEGISRSKTAPGSKTEEGLLKAKSSSRSPEVSCSCMLEFTRRGFDALALLAPELAESCVGLDDKTLLNLGDYVHGILASRVIPLCLWIHWSFLFSPLVFERFLGKRPNIDSTLRFRAPVRRRHGVFGPTNPSQREASGDFHRAFEGGEKLLDQSPSLSVSAWVWDVTASG